MRQETLIKAFFIYCLLYTSKTLLAGNLYCAHCGIRLSGFWHKDRYRLADGTVKEVMAPKYNCYAKGLKVRPCDGQQLYKAEIVDEIVEGIAKDIFAMISRMPKDPTIEAPVSYTHLDVYKRQTSC